jgi:hypothetical protein
MPVGLGPRFLIEAGFLIAVAIVAGVARFGTWTIVLVMACAWLVVAAVEWFAAQSRRRAASANDAPPAPEPAVWAEPRRVVVAPPPAVQQPQQLEPQPAPPPEVTPQPIPEPTPQRDPEPEPSPEPEPQSEPEPAPIPEQPRVQLVPPEPEPESEPEPTYEPEPAPPVVSITSRMGPREWNLWDLERIARDSSGSDVARDEERNYLLMYLRDFANADGLLPADFDSVVRESFGDVLDAAYSS